MPLPLRILLIEDDPLDAELLVLALSRAGFDPDWQRIETEAAYLERLEDDFDVVFSDHILAQFSGLRALELLQARKPEVPFIMVSGAVDEEMVVAAMKRGAADCLAKDRLTNIGPSVRAALEQGRRRREREKSDEALGGGEQNPTVANERFRALAARIETVREQERTAIAREIHDVLAQELTRLKIDLVWLARRLERPVDETTRPALAKRIASATAQADTAIETVQRIATELRPVILDSLGLPAAVEWQAEDFARRTGLVCNATAPRGESAIDRDRATALFRILQESLTNIARHAGASAIDVYLTEEPDAVTLTVQDNGRGIAREAIADPHSIGLIGMQERAQAFGGTLQIARGPSGGTFVTVRLPLARSSKPIRNTRSAVGDASAQRG